MSKNKKIDLINLIHQELPQIQCGRCKTPGCHEYASEIADGVEINRCVPGGNKTLKKLNKIFGKSITAVDKDYGPSIPFQKATIVESECIGCTKCIDACPVDAISGASNLLHVVIDDICTGCELCIPPCPVDCIDLYNVSEVEILSARNKSQEMYNNKKRFKNTEKRKKINYKSSVNDEISSMLNKQIKNRKIDRSENIKKYQEVIAKNNLENNFNLTKDEINKILNEKRN